LSAYFPTRIREHYQQHLTEHPLAHAIKATVVSNKIINQAGCGFLSLNGDNGHANILDSVNCYLTFDRVLHGDALRQAVHALDNQIAADKQYQLLLQLENILADLCRWTLAQGKKIRPNAQTIACYSQHLKDYEHYFTQRAYIETEQYQAQLLQYRQDGIPDELAQQMVFISNLKDFPFVVALATETQRDVATILQGLEDVEGFLGLSAIYKQLAILPKHEYWQRKVADQVESDIQAVMGKLLKNILQTKAVSCADYFELFTDKQKIDRYRQMYQEVITVLPVNLLPYIALIRVMQRLVESNNNIVHQTHLQHSKVNPF
jgi:glutamate dehydrogenase